ncbi:hypothetical protein K443DRAFT_678950 [Laccaria amethystina LaAM-08-1]|uniref:Uncharacterized protein n=1 Tax=Laccaria amethystina LaAM-08-1 TaxID=1095629 RepID=A0A0C9WQU3_9AGAR|nr:hypothetical protein K443DRAFT_678950 [Laccaria amethystina LaAM-08-1]
MTTRVDPDTGNVTYFWTIGGLVWAGGSARDTRQSVQRVALSVIYVTVISFAGDGTGRGSGHPTRAP